MIRRSILLNGTNDESLDSGAETAESDCSKMSSPSSEVLTWRLQEPLLINMHLLANPGDSLLLQHTLDRLLRWLCPSLHIFHVSERACPLRDYARPRLCPVAGYPSLAVTIFLHEAYGEERILRVLDFLQRPPWQYHHTERCGSRAPGDAHISSSTSPANGPLRPYLLPSRDFYSLGAGMPVWGVRPVHCGGEMLRVTLYSCYDNFEDTVRLYETVLQRHAEEQKTGFCWFTLHTEAGLCLQLALKQLSPGVRVEPCSSAVLQFRVEEIGQLVPLLPNPCTPISATRWQTEDLDGNKILFQVKAPVQPQRPLTCAFPLPYPSVAPRGTAPAQLAPLSGPGSRPCSDPGLERWSGGPRCRGENLGSDSCCSTPPGSSCYSSQRSSPAHEPQPRPLCLSRLRLEPEPETNVDTGVPVTPRSGADVVTATSPDAGVLETSRSKRPEAVGAAALETLARELNQCLPGTAPPRGSRPRGSPGYKAGSPARDSRTSGDGPHRGPGDRGSGDRGSDRGPGDRGSDRGPGDRGSGDRGSGSGDRGSGDRRSGDRGSGDRGSDRGPGDRGSGSGDRGSGDRGSGDRGSDRGPGDRGSDRGPGDRGSESGDRGSGDRGDRGSGDRGDRTTADPAANTLSPHTHNKEPLDEFFI